MFELTMKAEFVQSTTFKTLYDNHQRANQRTKLEDKTPVQIKLVLDALLSETVSPASEALKTDITNIVFILFAQDTFDQSPSTLSFLNMMFSFVSMSLSTRSAAFFSVYDINVDATGQVGGCGSDGNCYNAFLRTVLPPIRSMITVQMGDAVNSIKAADKESQEASSALTRQDFIGRFNNVRCEVVLKMFKELVINMGPMTASSVQSMKTIGEILTSFNTDQSFINGSFLRDLSKSLNRFGLSYRDSYTQAFHDRQLRRQKKAEREAAVAAAVADADALADALADADADAVADVASPVAPPVAPQISSTYFLSTFARKDLNDMFEAFPPKLIFGAGMLIQILKSILSIENPNARNARYINLCKAVPGFFNMTFLISTFEYNHFSESEITSEFVDALKSIMHNTAHRRISFVSGWE